MRLSYTRALATLLASAFAIPALAGPGDLHEVTADLVNLRASPSDEASVRDRIEGGTQVIELRRDGGWLGVRVVPTGQEGWLYGELVRQVASSELGTEQASVGLGAYSGDLDSLLYQVNDRLGTPMLAEVAENGNTLTLTPTDSWLRASAQETQLMAAAAIYGMWKNYKDQSPVEVVLLDAAGEQYVVIRDDGEAGPQLTVVDRASGSES
jgi:Bacterial SH3 domain